VHFVICKAQVINVSIHYVMYHEIIYFKIIRQVVLNVKVLITKLQKIYTIHVEAKLITILNLETCHFWMACPC